jgi:head-tail adaptor
LSLRYRPGVQPSMRFRQDLRVFHILSVIDVEERRRWLSCLCGSASCERGDDQRLVRT